MLCLLVQPRSLKVPAHIHEAWKKGGGDRNKLIESLRAAKMDKDSREVCYPLQDRLTNHKIDIIHTLCILHNKSSNPTARIL